jgi:hypothetical protein
MWAGASLVAEARMKAGGQEEQGAGGADGPMVELIWEVKEEAGAVAAATVMDMEADEAAAEVTTSIRSQRQQMYICLFFHSHFFYQNVLFFFPTDM